MAGLVRIHYSLKPGANRRPTPRSVLQHVVRKQVASPPILFFCRDRRPFGILGGSTIERRLIVQRLPATDLRQVAAPCRLIGSPKTQEISLSLMVRFSHTSYDDSRGRSDPDSSRIDEFSL